MSAAPPVRVLVLCTGNICRSPMAEVLLDRERNAAGGAGAIESAGFLTAGLGAEPHAVKAMAERGLALDHHRSRVVDEDLLARSDLVIAMARSHVREAVVLCPDVFTRTLTLKELSRGAGRPVGARPAELADVLAAIGVDRRPSALLGDDPDDDVADPMGRSIDTFRDCAAEIEHHVSVVARLLWGDPGQ